MATLSTHTSTFELVFVQVLPQLLLRRQDVGPEAQRQQLPHGPHNELALLVEHEDGRLERQELAEKLAAHAAGRAEIVHVYERVSADAMASSREQSPVGNPYRSTRRWP